VTGLPRFDGYSHPSERSIHIAEIRPSRLRAAARRPRGSRDRAAGSAQRDGCAISVRHHVPAGPAAHWLPNVVGHAVRTHRERNRGGR